MLYIYNSSTDPYTNMAVEEYLLQDFPQAEEELFMLWCNAPAIIVGRNQNTLSEINYDYVTQHNIPVVRRLTGGGAVFHDLGNINYTFIVPDNGHASDFAHFSRPIIESLGRLGVDAALQGRNDLVIGGQKFSGTAQCVYKGRTMHHGTLLFSADMARLTAALKVKPGKIESKGIQSIRSRVTNISEHLQKPMAVEEFIRHVAETVCAGQARPYTFTKEEETAIRTLRDEKYATWSWNYGDSPKYTVYVPCRFESGQVEIYLNVVQGSIAAVRIYGDFFGEGEISELERALVGTAHRQDAVEKRLTECGVERYIWGADAAVLAQALF